MSLCGDWTKPRPPAAAVRPRVGLAGALAPRPDRGRDIVTLLNLLPLICLPADDFADSFIGRDRDDLDLADVIDLGLGAIDDQFLTNLQVVIGANRDLNPLVPGIDPGDHTFDFERRYDSPNLSAHL